MKLGNWQKFQKLHVCTLEYSRDPNLWMDGQTDDGRPRHGISSADKVKQR